MRIEDLDVFKLAHEMALRTYKVTATFPEKRKVRYDISDEESIGINLHKPYGGSSSYQ